MLVSVVVSGETSIRQSEHGREVEVRLSGRRVREERATGTREAAEVVVKDGDGREMRRWVRGRFMVRGGAWDAADGFDGGRAGGGGDDAGGGVEGGGGGGGVGWGGGGGGADGEAAGEAGDS